MDRAANDALRRWYAPRGRSYPWRVRPTPYRVLVSEIMLQQTQASRVVPVFRAFLRSFPSVRALARASRGDVLRAWSGLGYNRRAVALHRAARRIVERHGGQVPRDPSALRALPGVGPYTAAAVAALAHGVPVPAIDVNVARVVGRIRLGTDGGTAGEVAAAAEEWLDRSDPGAWNQALMDLGRTVCRPAPRCETCPVAPWCAFRRAGARPDPARSRQATFEGSSRQVRGALIRSLTGRTSASLGTLAREAGVTTERARTAAETLATEGLVVAGPAALAGRSAGRLRLPS